MSITTYTDLELRLQAEVAELKSENENLRAYAKHERSLGAEAFAMENLDLTQQVEILKAKLERVIQYGKEWETTALDALAQNTMLDKKLAEIEKELQCMKAPRGFIEQPSIDGIVRTTGLVENK